MSLSIAGSQGGKTPTLTFQGPYDSTDAMADRYNKRLKKERDKFEYKQIQANFLNDNIRKLNSLKTGRRGTVLTSGLGDSGGFVLARKTLLGQ